MLPLWVNHGDSLRSDFGNDLALADFLCALLPVYRGPDRVLYRTEFAFNRRRRTYGASWSADVVVGRCFAENSRRMYECGTVLLEARVPAAAIICAPVEADPSHRAQVEQEYLVDRRRLPPASVRDSSGSLTSSGSPARCRGE